MIENPIIVETKIVDNFLSPEDILMIEAEEKILTTYGHKPSQFVRDGVLQNEITGMDKNAGPIALSCFSKSRELLFRKLKEALGDDVEVHGMHILKSFYPYKIHTDGIYGEYGIDDNNYGAWTCVIPLEECDTNTIIFNEWYVKTKMLNEWIDDLNPPILESVDMDTYNKYLDLEYYDYIRRLSVDTIFHWKVGSMMAASRYKFHCSDNFPKAGIPYKKAIIVWTTKPNKA